MRAEPTAWDIPETAAIGESYVLTGFVFERGNVSVDVLTPRGNQVIVARSMHEVGDYRYSVAVTREWGWGEGSVRIAHGDGENASLILSTFEMTCPPACTEEMIVQGTQRAATPAVSLAFAMALLAVLHMAQSAHVYRVGRREISWWDRVMAVVHPMRRDAIRADYLQLTGYLSADKVKRLHELREALIELDERRRTDRDADRLMRRLRIRLQKESAKIPPPPMNGGNA